jgi:hypothetical protein
VSLTLGLAGMKQPSLGGMADAMKAMLSRQALHQRFTQAAVAFMQGCLERMLRRLSVEAVVCTPLLQLFKRVLMLDSSSWDVAPALRHLLPGSGGSASAANCKVQVCLDYLTGLICFVQSTAGTRPDNTSVDPVLEMLQPQDLLLFDLGYFRLKTFRRIVDMGAFFLSRLCAQVTLCDAGTGTPIDLCTWLRTTCANTCCRQVMLGPAAGTQVTCRLICLRVAAHIAEQRRRTMKRNAVKKGHTCSQRHHQKEATISPLIPGNHPRIGTNHHDRHPAILNLTPMGYGDPVSAGSRVTDTASVRQRDELVLPWTLSLHRPRLPHPLETGDY